MDRLDDKNLESFGSAVRSLYKYLPDESNEEIGKLVENIYLRFQREAERDARDRANGKSSN
jgi:hypothetical protein